MWKGSKYTTDLAKNPTINAEKFINLPSKNVTQISPSSSTITKGNELLRGIDTTAPKMSKTFGQTKAGQRRF